MIADTTTADLGVRGVPQWLVVGESARDLKILAVVGITEQNNHLQTRKRLDGHGLSICLFYCQQRLVALIERGTYPDNPPLEVVLQVRADGSFVEWTTGWQTGNGNIDPVFENSTSNGHLASGESTCIELLLAILASRVVYRGGKVVYAADEVRVVEIVFWFANVTDEEMDPVRFAIVKVEAEHIVSDRTTTRYGALDYGAEAKELTDCMPH